jgi:hypothetical protein
MRRVRIALILAAMAASGCRSDGRQLRQPTQPLPATTTTSTTIPPILSGAAVRLP